MKLSYEGLFKNKYAGRSPERILCLYSVRLVLLCWPAATAAALRINVVLYIIVAVIACRKKDGHANLTCTQLAPTNTKLARTKRQKPPIIDFLFHFRESKAFTYGMFFYEWHERKSHNSASWWARELVSYERSFSAVFVQWCTIIDSSTVCQGKL